MTGVVAPDSTDTVAPDPNGDGDSTVSAADHTSTAYDRLGRVESTTDQNDTTLSPGQQRGVTHTYSYGPNGTPGAGQVTLDSATIPPGSGVDTTVQSIGTTYDDMGRVQFVTSYPGTDGGSTPLNEVFDAYDGWGNLAEEWQNPDGQFTLAGAQPAAAPTVEYTYADGASGGVAAYLRLESVTYPNNRVVQYNYNDGPQAAIDEVMSRLGSISNAGNTDTYAVESYLGLDDIVTEDYKDPQVKCDLSSDDYSGLDRFGRVNDMTWWQYDNSGNLTNNLDEDVYWRLNLDGNVTDQIELAANMSQVQNGFGYDAMGRLTSYSHQIGGGTAATSTWTYDSVGNNIDSATGGQYDLANEETTINGSSVSRAYDAAGNMQTLSTGDGAIYDAWDRLVEVYNPSTSTIVARFSYDGTGRRVEQLTGFTPGDLTATGSATSVTRYYYSGQQLVEGDTAVSGVTTTRYQYLWSPRYIDAPILRDTLNTDSSVNTGDRIFYLTDANYNVTAVVGMSGGSWQVVERYRYDAYGKVTVCSPNGNAIGGNASQVGNTILYAGETFDSSTGLYYDRARYYDPQLGRFISQDPMGAAGSGSNLYAYCGDNPTDATDPSGCWGDLTTGSTWISPPDMAVIGAYKGIANADGQPVTDPAAAAAAGFHFSAAARDRVNSISVETDGSDVKWKNLPFDYEYYQDMLPVHTMTHIDATLHLGQHENDNEYLNAPINPYIPEDALYHGFRVDVKFTGDARNIRVEQWIKGTVRTGVFSTLDPATDQKYQSAPSGLDGSVPPGNPSLQIGTENVGPGVMSYYDAPCIPWGFWMHFVRTVTMDLDFLVLAYATDKCSPPAVIRFSIRDAWSGSEGAPSSPNPLITTPWGDNTA